MDDFRARLAAFVPGGAEGVVFAGADGVLQAELQRVEAHFAGDFFHVALQRPEALRHAVAAVCARRRGVGVHDVGVEADVGRLAVGAVADVERHGLVTGVAGDGQGVAAIRAGIRKHAHLVGGDGAVGLDAGLHPDFHRVARAGGQELFFAGGFVEHRPAGGDGQVGGHVFDEHFLLAAKTAADARLDDADALDRQAEHRREHAAHVEGHLRGRADDQPVVFIPPGDGHVRFDVRLLHLGHFVHAFEHPVGFGEAFFHVADVDADFGGQVAAGVAVGEVDVFRLVVDDRRARLEGFFRVEDGRQFFVFHVNQRQGLLGDFGCFGGHEGHPVADETHLVVQ